jgi:ribonuclease P protein component
MQPPQAPTSGNDAGAVEPPAAVLSCAAGGGGPLVVLSKRSEFTRAAAARRQSSTAFLLQARKRGEAESATGIRIGYTCSKKVGNAVMRNRAKRRLREVARAILPGKGLPGWDYVLVGRAGVTASHPFSQLLADLEKALSQIHAKP